MAVLYLHDFGNEDTPTLLFSVDFCDKGYSVKERTLAVLYLGGFRLVFFILMFLHFFVHYAF
jgi:hypothetical protein